MNAIQLLATKDVRLKSEVDFLQDHAKQTIFRLSLYGVRGALAVNPQSITKFCVIVVAVDEAFALLFKLRREFAAC